MNIINIKKEKALTLIELLVVIVIIAILTAIAIPQIQGVIARARNAAVIHALSKVQSESGKLLAARRTLVAFDQNQVVRDAKKSANEHLGTGAMTLNHDHNRRFCAYVRLLDGRIWCTDNTPFAGAVSEPIHCTRTVGGVAGTYRCRPVVPVVLPWPTAITITPDPAIVATGGTLQMGITPTPHYARTEVTWGIDAGLCTITPAGLLIAPATAGSCQVRAVSQGAPAGGTAAVDTQLVTVTAPFNFSMSVYPTSGTVTRGGSVTTTARATLISGIAQSVSFTCPAPLPTGVTCIFSPTSCLPTEAGCTSSLTISTTAATPATTHSITVQGSGGGLTRDATYSLTVNVPAAVINVTPTSLYFGSRVVNTNTDLNFTVTNAAATGASALVGTASVPAGPFSCFAGCSYNLAPGASQDVTIRFRPTATGAASATVTFTDGGGATRPVSGTGTTCVASPTLCRRVFVTSTTTRGRITHGTSTGLAAADAICQDKANAANLGGTWKAWLSSTTHAHERLRRHTIPIYLVNRTTRVANNWVDLTDRILASSINHNENNVLVGDVRVWTGTSPSGARTDYRCSNWTNNSDEVEGVVGRTNTTGAGWTYYDESGCNYLHRIYCMEQ